MTTTPRFDDLVFYLIPVDLYSEILAAIGLPYASLLCILCESGVYAQVSGGEAKNLLDLLHQPKSEKCDGLSSELYIWIAEGEPPEEEVPLQEV